MPTSDVNKLAAPDVTNDQVMSEAHCCDDPRTKLCNGLTKFGMQPGRESDLANSKSQPLNSFAESETQPGRAVDYAECMPKIELNGCHTPFGSRLVNSKMISETLADNQNDGSTIMSNYQLSESQSETPHNSQMVNSGTPFGGQPVKFEIFHDNHLVSTEALPGDHLTDYEPMPDFHLDNSEIQHSYELASSDALPSNQVNIETLHKNALGRSEPMINYDPDNYEIVGYNLGDSEAPTYNEEGNPEIQPNKRRKRKSMVWEYFTVETVSIGCRRAICKQCRQSFSYSTGSKVSGTSHLKRHIAKGTCTALLHNQEKNQLCTPHSRLGRTGNTNTGDTPKRRYMPPNVCHVTFDLDRYRDGIARMIIMHDYPLNMVEHSGFVAFVQNLQPNFKAMTFDAVQGDCIATYLTEKQNIMKLIDGMPGRLCLTLDMWTSNQWEAYIFITGHFIDGDWRLQRRILNFVMEPYPDSDSALSHAVTACISDWNLEGRLFSITSSQPLSAVTIENLRSHLSERSSLILNGQLLVRNCIAHTLSRVAQNVLGSAQETVKRIRDSIKHVKTMKPQEVLSSELMQKPWENSLCLDDQAQWNTTYQMLEAASEFKKVFACLDASNADHIRVPSEEDWELVETLCTYLRPLFHVAKTLTVTTCPTAVNLFHELWKFQLDLARAVTSEDLFVRNLTKMMHEIIDEYWRDCCLALAIAVVMDPRFKMKLVQFSFSKIYGDDDSIYVKIVEDGIHELFREYSNLPLSMSLSDAEELGEIKMDNSLGGTLLSDNGLTEFDAYLMETTSHHKSELDLYLDESLLPRDPDFDILGWWKLNKRNYPVLSKMARDILSIPVCTVPPDSIFNTKTKELDQSRSSLRPETVEALICTKDWLQYA